MILEILKTVNTVDLNLTRKFFWRFDIGAPWLAFVGWYNFMSKNKDKNVGERRRGLTGKDP